MTDEYTIFEDAQHRADMCKMLSGRVKELEAGISELSEALGYAHAQVDVLRGALEPFAEMWKSVQADDFQGTHSVVKVYYCKEAAKALETTE